MINMKMLNVNYTLDQMNLTDDWKHSGQHQENTFFSSMHGTFFRTDHMLNHKTSLCKFKNTEIIPSTFSNHNGIKLKSVIEGKWGNS